MTDQEFNKALNEALANKVKNTMISEKMVPSNPIKVTVISDTPAAPVTVVTPDSQPNLIISAVTPIRAISVRFINSYLTMLVSLVGAGMTTNIIPASDFIHLVYKCAALSLASAGLGLLKDLVTVFGKLEGKYPLSTGSV